MPVRDATELDLVGILAIYNDAVLTTTAVWNETVVDIDNRRIWLRERQAKGYPVLVAVEDASDAVAGYASFGDWRAFDGYRHTVEHSVYVRSDRRGAGLARSMMLPLIDRAVSAGKHVMVAGIAADNEASLRLHARLGFERTGLMREVGIKFGRWLDLVFMQRILAPAVSASPGSGP